MTKRNPFDEIERMFDRMSRQFEQFEPGIAGGVAVDVADHGEEFVVTADLPGYDRGDIDVQLADDTLRISAEHSEEREEDGEYLRRERSRRSASRSVRLPGAVDEAGTDATYSNGVLTVTLPKRTPDEEGTNIPVG